MTSFKQSDPASTLYSDGTMSDKSNVLKILAIDDEEIMGYLIQRIVKHLGHNVDWVTNFESALQKMDEEEYDVILSDFKMPKMTGDTFYKQVTKKNKAFENRLVFITGDTVNIKTQKFLNSIKVPYLSKPFNIEDLRKTIIQIAGKAKGAKKSSTQ